MRMWMVEPRSMCDKHLLGEHAETHMLGGTLSRRRSIDGFIAKGLLEPGSLVSRHDALATEMASRGFRHASPLAAPDTSYLPEAARSAKVDPRKSARDLAARCERCRSAFGT